MNTHFTKLKGDIAVAKAIADLTSLGGFVFLPLSENCRYDLIVDYNGELFTIQVKYCADGVVPSASSWSDQNGNHRIPYEAGEFDCFAVYHPQVDKVLYVPSSSAGITIRTVEPLHSSIVNWWEDFLIFPPTGVSSRKKRVGSRTTNSLCIKRVKRIKGPKAVCSTCGVKVAQGAKECMPCSILSRQKIAWPDDDKLRELVWSLPSSLLSKQLGVSDRAIGKHCQARGIPKPSRGYWTKRTVSKS